MSDDNSEWWPGAPDPGNMVRNPAFTVQRLQKGIIEGGDWVRGSHPQFVGGHPRHLPDGSSLLLWC